MDLRATKTNGMKANIYLPVALKISNSAEACFWEGGGNAGDRTMDSCTLLQE